MSIRDLGAFVVAIAIATWLGGFLLARDPRRPHLRRAGLGLLAYALALAALSLSRFDAGGGFERAWASLRYAPAILWHAGLLGLLPEESATRVRLESLWPLSGLLLFAAALWRPDAALTAWGTIALLGIAFVALLRHLADRGARLSLGLVAAATLFFGLASGLLLWPAASARWPWLSQTCLALAMSFDFALLGLAIASWDALDLGERVAADLTRSGLAAMAVTLLLGGQVVLAIQLARGPSLALALLLETTVVSGIAMVTFAGPIAGLLDRMIFARRPEISAEREALRHVGQAVLRRAETAPGPEATLAGPGTEALTRHVRQALSQYGDLGRLASSPLAGLALVERRLAGDVSSPGESLDRARELRRLLAESIDRLKPPEAVGFGTTAAWHHYNVLYFPYVRGLRPSSRRAGAADLEQAETAALEWMRREVPERTLYNWQRSAARIVAADLAERNRALLEQRD